MGAKTIGVTENGISGFGKCTKRTGVVVSVVRVF